MDCNRIRERLDEYILGGLELPGRAMVAMHVANCYECREELQELETLLNELVPTLRHPLPVDRFGELLAAIDEDRRKARASIVESAWRRRTVRRTLAVAAAVALFVLAGPWLSRMVSAPFEDPAQRAEAAVQPPAVHKPDLKDLIQQRAKLERSLLEEPQAAPLEEMTQQGPATPVPDRFGLTAPGAAWAPAIAIA